MANEELYRKTYPIAIIQDRYMGAYSGGEWIAISRIEDDDDSLRRFNDVWGKIHGVDTDAIGFWREFHAANWLGVGTTPNEALADLIGRQNVGGF